MKITALSGLAAAFTLSACVTHMPQTADEFRKAIPGARFGKTETFEVDRSYRAIGTTFQQRAQKCLAVRIRTTSQTTSSYQVLVTSYKPTVIVTKQRAELHLQEHHEKGVLKVHKEPPGGYYQMVVDAYPIGPRKSRVQIFGASIGSDVLHAAVRGWATGKNLGCPDMTKR